MGQMHELALFAGAGGGILGGKLLGWRTVCAVEIDEYARSVLLARQNDGILEPFPIWDNVETFDGKPWRGLIDVVSGGFPCQDISCAGQGKGITGSRSGLWKEMARIVGEVRPRFVFVENSPALRIRGLTVVLADFAKMGFDAQWCFVSASECGAPHKRDRIWILAYPNGEWQSQSERGFEDKWGWPGNSGKEVADTLCNRGAPRSAGEKAREEGQTGQSDDGRSVVSNPKCERCAARPKRSGRSKGADTCWCCKGTTVADAEGICRGESPRETELEPISWQKGDESFCNCQSIADTEGKQWNDSSTKGHGGEGSKEPARRCGFERSRSWWSVEPDVGRVVNELANRMDRLRAIGNGQVPVVAATSWRLLNDE